MLLSIRNVGVCVPVARLEKVGLGCCWTALGEARVHRLDGISQRESMCDCELGKRRCEGSVEKEATTGQTSVHTIERAKECDEVPSKFNSAHSYRVHAMVVWIWRVERR